MINMTTFFKETEKLISVVCGFFKKIGYKLYFLLFSHVLVLTYVQTRHRSAAPFTPRILFCGPPGSGKSLQAALIAQKYSVVNSKFSVNMHFAQFPLSLFLIIYLLLSYLLIKFLCLSITMGVKFLREVKSISMKKYKPVEHIFCDKPALTFL